MRLRLALFSLAALLVAAFSARAAPLSLTLRQPPAERPLALDISGSYGADPGTIMVRDAVVGGVVGLAGGALIGVAADSAHTGRDALIGGGVGLLLGAAFGLVEAQAGPHIAVHTDRAGLETRF